VIGGLFVSAIGIQDLQRFGREFERSVSLLKIFLVKIPMNGKAVLKFGINIFVRNEFTTVQKAALIPYFRIGSSD
jgi:hypothetical protein